MSKQSIPRKAKEEEDKNNLPFKLTLRPEICFYIKKISDLGVYGLNEKEVARHMIDRGVRTLMREHNISAPTLTDLKEIQDQY